MKKFSDAGRWAGWGIAEAGQGKRHHSTVRRYLKRICNRVDRHDARQALIREMPDHLFDVEADRWIPCTEDMAKAIDASLGLCAALCRDGYTTFLFKRRVDDSVRFWEYCELIGDPHDCCDCNED